MFYKLSGLELSLHCSVKTEITKMSENRLQKYKNKGKDVAVSCIVA